MNEVIPQAHKVSPIQSINNPCAFAVQKEKGAGFTVGQSLTLLDYHFLQAEKNRLVAGFWGMHRAWVTAL